MDEQQRREEATQYVGELRGFYQHLMTYVITNIVLIIINFVVDPHNLWFYWVTIFWGLAVLTQAFRTFGPGRKLTKSWEEKKINEYMNKSANDSKPKDDSDNQDK